MPAPPPDARSFRSEVTAVEPCGDDGVILRLRPEVALPPIRASRFFMLRREDRDLPLIPRPFSIYRQAGDEIEFLIKVMGRGTKALSECEPGNLVRNTTDHGVDNGWV